MANPLTGDFEAVAQVSGRTLNRLLASMHQNTASGKDLPTLPHEAVLRIGDQGFQPMINGVRGTAWAQIGVPSIELIPGADDRFIIEAWIRVHFEPDPATTPLPEFIYGKVRAEYALSAIVSPVILGKIVFNTLLRFEPVQDRVSFTSATGDTSADPQITEQVRAILKTRLLPRPHPLLADFSQKRFRSLVSGGETAVVYALSLSGQTPSGNLASVNQVVLGGKDLAVAVSREHIMSLIEPTLAALKAVQQTVPLKVEDLFGGTTTVPYTVQITSATAQWTAGTITLDVQGTATTPKWWAPNVSFSVTQKLALTFDAATETLAINASEPPNVSVHVNGLFGGLLAGYARAEVTALFNQQLTAALTQLQPGLKGALTQKQTLIAQLKTIDEQAEALFEAAEFIAEGIILRGTISLSPRKALWVKAKRLMDDSGYTALESWVPGGRIVRFDWYWYWKTDPLPAGTPPDGSQAHQDRFLLRTTAPLPGILHFSPTGEPPKVPTGRVCLTVRGVAINAHTGLEENVDNAGWAERNCVYVVPTPPGASGLGLHSKRWWTVWLIAATAAASGTAAERVAAYVEAAGVPSEPFNTLVHYLDGEDGIGSLAALEEGLRGVARDDAGVLVALVFKEGWLERAGTELISRLDAFAARLEVPLMITEDVRQGWSQSLELRSGQDGAATRLLTTNGEVAWRHDGATGGPTLSTALREHLQPSPPPRPEPLELTISTGEEVPNFWFEGPPGCLTSLQQFQGRPVSLTFVQPWARPCLAQLHRLQRQQARMERQGVAAMALVTGFDETEAQALVQEHNLTFPVLGDLHGVVAARFGVRAWPTTVVIDEDGRLVAVEMGADPGALAAFAGKKAKAVTL